MSCKIGHVYLLGNSILLFFTLYQCEGVGGVAALILRVCLSFCNTCILHSYEFESKTPIQNQTVCIVGPDHI